MSEHAPKTDSVDERDNLGEIYFKIQSELDFTKHPGALDATDDHIVTRAQGNQEDSRVLQGT